MADIVRRSGMSHGAVYGYFQSKDDIIEALADDRHQREAILNSVVQNAKNPIEGIHALVRAYAGWVSDPAGVRWETFYTFGDAVTYGEDHAEAALSAPPEAAACCGAAKAPAASCC